MLTFRALVVTAITSASKILKHHGIKKPTPITSSYTTRLLPPYPPPEKKTQVIASLSVSVQLKGTVPRDFRLLVYIKPLSIPLGPIRLFFENSRRYSQLNAQMENIFYEKSFNYFVWTPLGIRVNIYINFCLQVHSKVSAD
jgi:hypothetical protein